MADLFIDVVRGSLRESVHRVSAAVVTADGSLVAASGDPHLVAYWRSAAKPFQLLPLIEDGGVERFGLDRQMVALACASHNAEPIHREVAQRWLDAIGLGENELACGGHPSLWPALAQQMIRDDLEPTPIWSNCSGKHAAMLAQAKLHGWPTAGYQRIDHPVQRRIAATIAQWTAVPEDALVWGVDGCTAAAVALPLAGMATAYARLGTSLDGGPRRIREAMMGEPYLIAGADRLDTALMQAWPGRIVVKTGAEGVYSAALPELGLGVALKVEDGASPAAPIALVAVLEQLTGRLGGDGAWPLDGLDTWRQPPIRNTRGELTGRTAPSGVLRFL
jgi:L-asparaginase II